LQSYTTDEVSAGIVVCYGAIDQNWIAWLVLQCVDVKAVKVVDAIENSIGAACPEIWDVGLREEVDGVGVGVDCWRSYDPNVQLAFRSRCIFSREFLTQSCLGYQYSRCQIEGKACEADDC
jgi:hypothetical protein